MSKDVSVEFLADGEVRITKHRDTEEARETVDAIKRAVEFFNKNDGDYTPGAYADHEDAEDDDQGEHDDGDEEAELTPRQRRAAEYRRQLEALARAGVPPPGTTTTRKARTMTMDDLTGVVSNICKRADGITVTKLATFEVGQGGSRFSSFERASMIGAIAKAQDCGGGSDDQKFSRFLQDPGNMLLRQWAMLPADVAELSKRADLFDDVIAKARAAGDGVMGTRAIGGREAFAVGAGERGAARTEADARREEIIANKRTAAPFMTEAQLGRYADDMLAELERVARGKQERARPGTLERA
jgi:hypothetical protein